MGNIVSGILFHWEMYEKNALYNVENCNGTFILLGNLSKEYTIHCGNLCTNHDFFKPCFINQANFHITTVNRIRFNILTHVKILCDFLSQTLHCIMNNI